MSLMILQNRWRREWRRNGRSLLSISFSHSLHRTTYYGSIHLYVGRWTIEWQIERGSASVRAHFARKVKPLKQWTASEKREAGIIDVKSA